MTFKNTLFKKRDYECTNVVACVADSSPGEHWLACDSAELKGLQFLWSERGVEYFGYL